MADWDQQVAEEIVATLASVDTRVLMAKCGCPYAASPPGPCPRCAALIAVDQAVTKAKAILDE